jgi:predicted metal-dependent hydrolase
MSEARSRWGSCGSDGVIRAHWQLVRAPNAAFEYGVAHEVAHLLHRHHVEDLGRTLARTLPTWAARKAMLERWEGERRAV